MNHKSYSDPINLDKEKEKQDKERQEKEKQDKEKQEKAKIREEQRKIKGYGDGESNITAEQMVNRRGRQ